MNENETSTETVAVTKRNSPSAEVFIQTCNAASSRADAVERFHTAGYDMTYSALVARYKSYKDKGVTTLKDIPSSPRGRRLDVAALNAATATPVV